MPNDHAPARKPGVATWRHNMLNSFAHKAIRNQLDDHDDLHLLRTVYTDINKSTTIPKLSESNPSKTQSSAMDSSALESGDGNRIIISERQR